MEISFSILWEIKVYHHIDGLNVNTTCEQVSTHEITACTIPEVMEHSVSVVLKHLCMDVKA
jgi:hypothetical protein